MAVLRQVTTNASATFLDIVATIPCHYLKVWQDADRNAGTAASAIEYKSPDDNFATTKTTDSSVGDIIERIGPGKNGLLGAPAAFAGPNPPTATVLLKVHMADNSAKVLNVYESEYPL